MYLALAKSPHLPTVRAPHLQFPVSASLDGMLPVMLLIAVVVFAVIAFATILRWLIRGPGRGSYTPPSPSKIVPKPKLPDNSVPPEVQKLIGQLKEAAKKVTQPADQQNLQKICETLPQFYKRRQKLGGGNAYAAKIEVKLKSLVGAMTIYLHIQADPAFYTFDGAEDELYLGITKPKKWLEKASQAIQSYLNLLNAAMRDDSKLEVTQLNFELDNLLSGNPD